MGPIRDAHFLILVSVLPVQLPADTQDDGARAQIPANTGEGANWLHAPQSP